MFYDRIIAMNTEIHQRVILQVSVRELHIDVLKKMLLDFPWHTDLKDLSVLVILLLN